jgi:hypothetical protein
MLFFRGCDPIPYRYMSSLPLLVAKAAGSSVAQTLQRNVFQTQCTKIDCSVFRTGFCFYYTAVFLIHVMRSGRTGLHILRGWGWGEYYWVAGGPQTANVRFCCFLAISLHTASKFSPLEHDSEPSTSSNRNFHMTRVKIVYFIFGLLCGWCCCLPLRSVLILPS